MEKITSRNKKWSKLTGLSYEKIKLQKLDKGWGSCTPANNIIINTEAIKLPFSLIDYLIVHKLRHTKVKNHTKEFWRGYRNTSRTGRNRMLKWQG